MTFGKALAVLAGCGAIALATASHAAGASACTALGGTLGRDQVCEVHASTTTYDLTFRFPTDYPDQQAVADFLTQRRQEFIDWVARYPAPGRVIPYALDVIGKAYQSTGTQSLVLDIGNDTGVHPVTTYKAFNYSLANRAPVTFETLFKPGTNPLAVLNPIVRQQVLTRDPTARAPEDLTAASYQQFAITDDAIIFFFNQDGLLPHEDGPLEVSVPRGELAPMLA